MNTFSNSYAEDANTNYSNAQNEPAKRERVNFIIDSSIMERLRSESKSSQIPMSRIIDQALTAYLNPAYVSRTDSFIQESDEIILYHVLEVTVFDAKTSELSKSIAEYLKNLFSTYISTSCLLTSKVADYYTLGTKFVLFISDQSNAQLDELLKSVEAIDTSLVEIRLDHKALYQR